VNLDDATRLAQEHVIGLPAPAPNYRITVGAVHELAEGWYFDYSIEQERELSPDEEESFAGAPGFLVLREGGTIRDIGWAEYHELDLHGA
jgi:hypothetical protein